MPRLCLVVCLVLVPSLELAAQNVVPDTTSPARYAPLHVGNVWHYRDTEWYGSYGVEVKRVLRDSTVSDTTYAVIESKKYWRDIAGNEGSASGTGLFRFDSTEAVVRQRIRGREVDEPYSICRLDTSFPNPQEDFSFCEGREQGEGMVWGSPLESISIGDTVLTVAAKSFDILGHGTMRAAGIGRVSTWYDGSPVTTQIEYAFIDGVRYGTPIAGLPEAVSSSASPTPDALSLRAFPSPTAGPITLALDLLAPQPVELSAFDALGRRVWRRELVTGRQRIEIDARAWAPGLYILRAVTRDASVTTTLIRR